MLGNGREITEAAANWPSRDPVPWVRGGTNARHLAAIALTAAGFTAGAQAQETPSGTEPLWELGAGFVAIDQQAYPGSSQSVRKALPFPYIIYRGEWLRADRSGLGLRAFESPNWELDVGISGALGSSSKNIEARRGMPDLGTLIEAGPRLTYFIDGRGSDSVWKAELALRSVLDVNDRFAFKGWSLEPRLTHERRSGPWRLSAGLVALVGDNQLNATYYGVTPAQATPTRPAFDARAGLINWRLTASTAYQATPQLRLLAYGSVNTLSGSANEASPLVKQRDGGTLGAGIIYVWAQSKTQVPKRAP
jgi:outer membrane protein